MQNIEKELLSSVLRNTIISMKPKYVYIGGNGKAKTEWEVVVLKRMSRRKDRKLSGCAFVCHDNWYKKSVCYKSSSKLTNKQHEYMQRERARKNVISVFQGNTLLESR